MPMSMQVGLSRRNPLGVIVLVMNVMDMLMLVFELVVNMFMLMMFAQVKPNPDAHQRGRQEKLD